MISLFIDTHSKKVNIALFKNEKILVNKVITENVDHSTICMPTVVEVINESNILKEDITDIVVVNGPGSFTGERLGVTIAKTLAYTLNIPIRTITSIEACVASKNIDKKTNFVLEEKNGYFIASFDENKNQISEYKYLNKEELAKQYKEDEYVLCDNYDLESIIKFAHKKEVKNPHEVNPFYVKKIEVEK